MQTENWLLKQARTNPDHVAIDDGTRRLTFRQVKNRAGQIAGQLDQLKIGSKVGLLSGNNLQAYLLAMAILASGRTIVWLNSDEELARQIADSQLNLCLVSDELRRHSMDQRSMTFSQFQRILAEPAQLVPTFDSDQIASIMYTSGTTGQPKGVLQSFGNHFYSAISSALNLGLTKHDEWLCVAPIFHISGFSILMRSLIYTGDDHVRGALHVKETADSPARKPPSLPTRFPLHAPRRWHNRTSRFGTMSKTGHSRGAMLRHDRNLLADCGTVR